MNADPNCIFCKIVAGQIPSRKAFEDEDVLVFHDIHPWAPVHLLIIAKEHGADNGFRTIINTGRDGGQEVLHLHMHVIGGPRPWKQG